MTAEDLIHLYTESVSLHWKKIDGGYELSNRRFKLLKRGKMWYLVGPNKEMKLGRKASFDSAERAIDKYFEAIQDPVSPAKWQRKPDKSPKYKREPQIGGGVVPPGVFKYADQGDYYQGVA